MSPDTGWKFAIEIHPPGWSFPAGASWLAGWLESPDGRCAAEVRAWIDGAPWLGLHGLREDDAAARARGRPVPSTAGFSFLLTPHAGARELRLEARDLDGRWWEFFRTPIGVDAAAPVRAPLSLAPLLETALPRLLRLARVQPDAALTDLAHGILAAADVRALDTRPNPPFAGALEEPGAVGRVEHGRVSVTGWLGHRVARITRLTACVDPAQAVELAFGAGRADIAERFPELVAHPGTTFAGHLDLPAGLEQPVLLKIFAELEDGTHHLVFAQRFRNSAGPAPHPPATGWEFTRAAWALQRAGRRLGCDTRGVAARARELWVTYPGRPQPPALPVAATGKDRPRRILAFTHNLNFEGAPRLLLELLGYFAREGGVTVHVVSPSDGPLRALHEAAGFTVQIVDVQPALAAGSRADFDARLREAGRTIDWSQADLVLANTLVTFWAVLLARAAGQPCLFYVHESSPPDRFFAGRLDPAVLPAVREALHAADRVTFTAEASRQVFAADGSAANTVVLPSWLDAAAIADFRRRTDRAALRQKHGFGPDDLVLLNLGTVCERKGQHVFVAAARLLEAELARADPGHRVQFVMVGARDDAFQHELGARIAAAGLQRVRLVPETRENLAWHLMADLLVCTSFEESSPRVLLEAALFDTPIVTTDVNGIPELVDGGSAWLVEPGDPYLLAAALRAALGARLQGDKRRPERARRAVLRRHDERVALPRHLALARAVASRPAG